MAKSTKSITENNDQPDAAARWQALLDEMNTSSGGGKFFYLKEGRTAIRLVPVNKDQDFFIETTNAKFGKSKFILSAWVLRTDHGDLADRWQNKVVPVIVPKSVLKGIVTLLAEGFDLLGPGGHGLTIVKTGKGIETTYNVLPSTKPVPVAADLTRLEDSLEELSIEYAESSAAADDGQASRSGGTDFGQDDSIF